MLVMRHGYLLRHPVGFGIVASVAAMELLGRFLSRSISSAS
jgi:hypothetical protein